MRQFAGFVLKVHFCAMEKSRAHLFDAKKTCAGGEYQRRKVARGELARGGGAEAFVTLRL